MKHLPKHLRPRWRYLAVRVETWPDAAVDRDAFQRALWQSARSLLGDAGSAELDLEVVRFAWGDGGGAAIVRTRRGETDRARAAVACLDAVDGHPVGLRVSGISGTIRACEEKYIGRRPEATGKRNVAFGGRKRSAVERDDRVDVCDETGYVGATELDLG